MHENYDEPENIFQGRSLSKEGMDGIIPATGEWNERSGGLIHWWKVLCDVGDVILAHRTETHADWIIRVLLGIAR